MSEQQLTINQPQRAPGAPVPDEKPMEAVKANTEALVKAQQEIEAARPKASNSVGSSATARADTVPSNWSILPGEGDNEIVASNSITGSTFEGTVVDFNKKYFR